jgi:uncharacterized membrane protein
MDHQEELNQASGPEINVSRNERLASVLGGSFITLLGLRRRSNFGAILAMLGGGLIYRGVTGHCPCYAATGKNTVEGAQGGARPQDFFDRGIHVAQALTIDKPTDELYRFWRNFENLPRFMDHLESVTVLDDRRSHWVAKGPAGSHVEWDAEIINDEPNRLIAWRSLEDADIHHTGSVRFLDAPGDGGTEVQVTLEYLSPGGKVGQWIAKLFGEEPEQQIREDLDRLKKVMESGEVAQQSAAR